MKHYIKPVITVGTYTFEEVSISEPKENKTIQRHFTIDNVTYTFKNMGDACVFLSTNGFFEVPADFDRFDLKQVETIRHNVSEHFYTNYTNQIKNNLK